MWYGTVHEIPDIQTGLAPINASTVLVPFEPGIVAALAFPFFGILSDSSQVTEAPAPPQCSGRLNCFSYYFPGPIDFTSNLSSSIIQDHTQYPAATTYIQKDAPGYQVSFYSLNENEATPFDESSCYFSGLKNTAIQICVVQNGTNLLTSICLYLSVPDLGYNVCPLAQSRAETCLQNQSWRTTGLTSSWVTITRRRATTIFDRFNSSIIDVIYLDAAGESTDYSSDDFYPVFNILFTIPSGTTDVTTTLAYQFLGWVTTNLQYFTTDAFKNQILQQLITLPVSMVTNQNQLLGAGPLPPDMGTSGILAKSTLRVYVSCLLVSKFRP